MLVNEGSSTIQQQFMVYSKKIIYGDVVYICNNGYGMKLGFEGVYFHVPQGREVASSSLSFSNNACLCVVSRSEYPVNLNEKQYN